MIFSKKNRHDPRAIARVILKVVSDAVTTAEFGREFASSEDEFPRVIFSAIIFAYCWGRHWSLNRVNRTDPRVADAYRRVADIIVKQPKDFAKLVRVSDYLTSEFELSGFYFELYKRTGEQIPFPVDPAADNDAALKSTTEAIQSYRVQLETLMRVVISMRNERMMREVKSFLPLKDIQSMFSCLADTLYEQISGSSRFNLPNDHALHDQRDLKNQRQASVLIEVITHLERTLDLL